MTCLPGYFYLSNSTGAYCFLVCPFECKPDYTSYQCVTQLVNVSKAGLVALTAASPVTSTAFMIANAVSGSFSLNMMMCLLATESLVHMQYLNINHSNIALTIYTAMSSSYIPNWIASFNDLEAELLIFPYGIFQTNQISSLFLDNFGDALTEIMIHLGMYLIMAGITYSIQIRKLSDSFVGRISVTVFSFFASGVIGKLQSELLYSVMQILKIDLFLDTYSRISFFTGYFIISFSIGLLIFCFFRALRIFQIRNMNTSNHSEESKLKNRSHIKKIKKMNEPEMNIASSNKWLEKKYEFLYEDFNHSYKNQFFFGFWLSAFNAIYILLIFSLQGVPVLQCFSIVILALVFILFPVIIKPFEKKVPAFLHFFNFSCIFIAATLNLALAITKHLNPDFTGTESQGKAVISVIIINTGTNTLISLGVMLFEIYNNYKSASKSKDKPKKPKQSKIELSEPRNQSGHQDPPKRPQKPLPIDSRYRHQRTIVSRSHRQSSSTSNTLISNKFQPFSKVTDYSTAQNPHSRTKPHTHYHPNALAPMEILDYES